MDKPSNNTRRTLITTIVILAVVQVAILGYLWQLLRPSEAEGVAQPAPFQFLRPPANTVTPEDPGQTVTPGTIEIVVGPPVPASDYSTLARMFDEEQALEHIAALASDEMGGRQPGTPDSQAASNYIAARFAEYGLEPDGVDEAYFQTFTLPYGQITSLPVLTVETMRPELSISSLLTHTYAYRADYLALTGGYLGAGEGEGPVVWLNQCLSGSYAGLDMVGKIALCRYTRNPEVYRQAIEHRVGGLLLLDRDREEALFRRGGYRDTAWVPQTVPAYLISETVAQDLLIGTDYTLDDLSLRFTATPLSTTVAMAVTTEEQAEAEGRNVLGLLPGSDPAHSNEIVVVGAHYDHLGHEPDGAIMNGANDNASGVAAILEIARLWQAQGFHPARSVLFAAWDGEEQGLLGSRYYAENPTHPLTQTVAMLNLDMISAGENLQIDGEGSVAAQLEASAAAYGITYTLAFMGRSDHASFYAEGIPSAMLIYWPDPVYHSPADRVDVIEPEKLKTVGVLSIHTLASLVEGYIELEQAVERMRASITAGDQETFIEGIDPTDPDLQASQAAWFENLWSQELTDISIRLGQMRIGNAEADVAVQLTYRWSNQTRRETPVSCNLRFVQQDGAWAFAGYELDTLSGDTVTVARFSDVPVETSELLTITQPTYLALAADLGLEPITDTRVIYYPDAATMRAIARPTADRDTSWLVSSAGLAEIAWGEPVTPALVSLILNQMGLPPDEGAWLREGLALHYESGAERRYLPTLVDTEILTPLLDLSALNSLPEREARVLRAYAWDAAEYLLDRYGNDGLSDLCAAWGRSNHGRSAFLTALELSPAQFESAWHADRLAVLRADAAGIQATLAARTQAVREKDTNHFLSTVTTTDPTLRAEERYWFTSLTDHPAVTCTITGKLVGWSSDRQEATVALNVASQISGTQLSQINYDGRFAREGDRWLYAGVAWNELASEHFVLKYQNHDAVWARRVLDLAEAAHDQVTADIGATILQPVEIKLYDDGPTFHTLVALLSPDWVTGRTERDESIRLWLQDDDEHVVQAAIAHELTRLMLYTQGMKIAWLREGVAAFEVDRLRSLGSHWGAAQYMPLVQDAARRREELVLDTVSLENNPGDERALAYAQSWSLVSYIADQHGLAGLRRFITQSNTSGDTTANLRDALSVDPERFLAEWQESALIAGVPDGLVSLARSFSPERALAHVAVLSSPEFGGRAAGAPGADLAATYIAEQFAALGLEPVGDLLTATRAITETAAMTTERGYLQQFPVSYTHIVSAPVLALLSDGGTIRHEFVYRKDFGENGGAGTAQGELVWVHTQGLEGIRFGGAVVLEQNVEDPLTRAVQLQRHGAGGLIVANGSEHFQTGRISLTTGLTITIPVFELTDAAFKALLEQVGMRQRDLSFAPPAFPLGVQVQQTLVRAPLTTTLTANILGLLPGNDPDLAGEVLIVGAHYDHIGQSPDGLYFPGANQNASGVGALLEMAQVWQSAGFRPARSVLFVAWGAKELADTGAAHYLAHPAIPLTQTVGVIALDRIGNGRGHRLLFYGTRGNDLALMYRIETGTAMLNRRAQRKFEVGEGWHALFNASGIPTAKLIWDEAEKDAYQLTDTAENIAPDRLAFSGEILSLVASWLASP